MCLTSVDPAQLDALRADGSEGVLERVLQLLAYHPPSVEKRFGKQALFASSGTDSQIPPRHAGNVSIRLLVVRASFPDCEIKLSGAALTKTLEGVESYYREVSGGLVALSWQVVGPVSLPRPTSDYSNGQGGLGSDEPNARTMIRNSLPSVHAAVSDFSPFDADKDGVIDAFVLVHAGRGAETFPPDLGKLIWSHRGFGARGFVTNGYAVDEFLTISEETPLGVWCHELGHLLFDWPDLIEGKDTDNPPITHTWCLMSSGGWNGERAGQARGALPSHPCAPLKGRQGWLSVKECLADGPTDIGPIEESNVAARIASPRSTEDTLFIEYRQRAHFDAALPGQGLIIWSVTATPAGDRIRLVPAGGPFDVKQRGSMRDAFPGSADVKEWTWPGHGVLLSEISAPDASMRFHVQGLSKPPGRTRAVR